MTVRYVLAPEAALDLAQIWRYIKKQSSVAGADHIESAIRDKITFLAQVPGAGHRRNDLTDEDVKFFSVYSYLIVYRPDTKPLQIVSTVVATWKKSSKVACEDQASSHILELGWGWQTVEIANP